MSLVLESKEGGNFIPHPEGIYPAVCVDVMDLGLVETEFQGQRRMTPRLKLVFETEQRLEDGTVCTVSKMFTASLHPKAQLAEFLGKWRGRPVVVGESIDLGKLIGACCTVVVSHQQNSVGRTYASLDAISKPTKKLAPSGTYDPAAMRRAFAEWKAKQPWANAQGPRDQGRGVSGGARAFGEPPKGAGGPPAVPTAGGARAMAAVPAPKSGVAAKPQPAADECPFDPEVGF